MTYQCRKATGVQAISYPRTFTLKLFHSDHKVEIATVYHVTINNLKQILDTDLCYPIPRPHEDLNTIIYQFKLNTLSS